MIILKLSLGTFYQCLVFVLPTTNNSVNQLFNLLQLIAQNSFRMYFCKCWKWFVLKLKCVCLNLWIHLFKKESLFLLPASNNSVKQFFNPVQLITQSYFCVENHQTSFWNSLFWKIVKLFVWNSSFSKKCNSLGVICL